jgi:hypothetical protein
VLDAGCGAGDNALEIGRRGLDVTEGEHFELTPAPGAVPAWRAKIDRIAR